MQRFVGLLGLFAIAIVLGACGAGTSGPKAGLSKPFAGMILSLDMYGPDDGWAAGVLPSGAAVLLATRDGGRTWQQRTPPDLHSVERLSMDAASPADAWVAVVSRAARVEACHTRSAGRGWRCHYVTAPHNANIPPLWPSQVDFVNASTGWIELQQYTGLVSAKAELWQTRDGGQTWRQLFPLDYQGFGAAGPVAFSSPSVGVHVVGYVYGYGNGIGAPGLYQTVDGGRSWTVRLPPGSLRGKDQQALPDYGMAAVTDDEFLWIIHDGQVNPALKLYDPLVDFFGRNMVAAATGRAAGPRDEAVYFSQDGGLHWIRTSFAQSAIPAFFARNWSYSVYQLDFVSRQVGFLLLNKDQVLRSVVFRTIDGGRHWGIVFGPAR